jgi:hypothetical protein
MRLCRLTGGLVIGAAWLLAGCDENTDIPKVLDAVVETTDTMFNAIDSDMSWQVAADPGIEILGQLVNANQGTLDAFGWRHTSQYDNNSGTFVAFGEKLFVTVSGWNANEMLLSGQLIITRHSMDYGPAGTINDVSRTTRYVGSLSTEGKVEGTFDIDVNAMASGNTLWTCGVINGEGVEHGECF